MFYKIFHIHEIYKHKPLSQKKIYITMNADLLVNILTFYIKNVIHFIQKLIQNLIFVGQLTIIFK